MSQQTSELNQDLVLNITQRCEEQFISKLNQVYCVQEYFLDNFHYVNTGTDIYPVTEWNEKGGDCKSASLYYKMAFENLGMDTHYIILSRANHLTVVGESDDFYCVADMKSVRCMELST